jgi:hypothetical protein
VRRRCRGWQPVVWSAGPPASSASGTLQRLRDQQWPLSWHLAISTCIACAGNASMRSHT